MKRPKPNATTVMLSMPMIVSGITWGAMWFRREKRIPTRLKPAMLSCVTTWLVWRDDRAASRVVLMLLSVLFAFLFIVSIIDNFINNASLIIPVMLRISLVHYFSHSQHFMLHHLSFEVRVNRVKSISTRNYQQRSLCQYLFDEKQTKKIRLSDRKHTNLEYSSRFFHSNFTGVN
jgi:hypothetical protein